MKPVHCSLFCLIVCSLVSHVTAKEMPDYVRTALGKLVGEWQMESENDGKKVFSEIDVRWANDESVVVFTWRGVDTLSGQKTSSTGMLGWDAVRQIVVEHEIGADGAIFHGTHHISKDGTWISPYEGSVILDDRPLFLESHRKIEFASKDEWTVTATHWILDGEAEERRVAKFTRRSPVVGAKSLTEADARKAIDAVVGQWNLTFVEDGEKKTAKITAEESGSDLVLRLVYQEPGKQPAIGMFAWHATKKQIVETWFRGGEHVRICFDRMTDDGALVGDGEGMLEGERFSGRRIVKFQSPNDYTHTITNNISDGESQPDVIITAKRIVSTPVEP